MCISKLLNICGYWELVKPFNLVHCNLPPPLTIAHAPGKPVSLWHILSKCPLSSATPVWCDSPHHTLPQLSQSETHNLALNYTLCSLIILCLLSLARLSSSGSVLWLAWLWSRSLCRVLAYQARGYSGLCLEHRCLHL